MDKDAHGDYLISARHTDCIYKISGKDGSILWRLGGTESSFTLDGFDFLGQHDARFHSTTKSTTTISFFDNGAAPSRLKNTSEISSVMVVELHTSISPTIAKLIKHYPRPDGRRTFRRGNAQILPNTNIIAGWSAQGYTTEFTNDGRLVLEAKFLSAKFDTYRSYKFPFVGKPTELPALKAYVYGTSPKTMTTVFYTSWNGATEVVNWRYYGAEASNGSLRLVGSARKAGFETVFQAAGFMPWSVVEGVDSEGVVLGTSDIQKTVLPPGFVGWKSEPCKVLCFCPSSFFIGCIGLDSLQNSWWILAFSMFVLAIVVLMKSSKRYR